MLRWLHEAFIDGGGDEGGVAAEKSKDGGGGTGRDEGKNYAGKMVKVASAVTPTTLRHSESEILK